MKRPRPPFVLTLGAVGLFACNDKPTPARDATAETTIATPPPEQTGAASEQGEPPDAAATVPVPADAAVPSDDAAPPRADAGAEQKPPPRMRDFPKLLNPKDAKGRTIKKGRSDSCFVELPYPPLQTGETRYPGTPPPSKPVTCPAEMRHPSYQSCQGGTLHQSQDGAECVCFVMGNPPPPPRRTDCPD